ncbi:dihydrolipoamide dehydrogenase [Salmonella enterica subsp. enterica]|uniref:Dihydrolipoamide dehydrogenase n=1 Tax=Salmonella enterica I TaxID=59201 RepID=A0A379X0K3_SALET|nr:dihydrolipoamide dehydrogenase [Salmonella enterica subsp. enterica]
MITQLTGGLAGMAKGRKVKVVNGLGKFTGANTLEVEGENGKNRDQLRQRDYRGRFSSDPITVYSA